MRVTGLTHASGMFMHAKLRFARRGHRERVSSTQESTIQAGIKYDRVFGFRASLESAMQDS